MKPFLSSVLLPALLSFTFSATAIAADAAEQTAKNSDPLTGLLNQIGSYSREEAAQNKAREAKFLSDLNTQKRMLSEARAA
ncbi:MAG: hypothetical protein KKH95_13650, partial [Gammaproteobacteria bacterium]|nr:hypothetical protein [Gammaproteobacteria bacterium]